MLLPMLLAAYSAFQDSASTATIAMVMSSVVSGAVMYFTKRSGDQATVKVSQITTRGDLEQQAFERAKEFYTDTIDRQAAELKEAEAEILELKARVAGCESRVTSLQGDVNHYRRTSQRLARGVHELRLTLGQAATSNPALDEAVIESLSDEPHDF